MNAKKVFRVNVFKLIVLLCWTAIFIWMLGQCFVTGGPPPTFWECVLRDLRYPKLYVLYFGILVGLYLVTCLLSWIYYKIKR